MVWDYYCLWHLLGYFVAQKSLINVGLHKDTLVDIIFTVHYLAF